MRESHKKEVCLVSELQASVSGKRFVLVRRLLRALPVIILVSVFTLLLEHYGWLKSFETATLDRFLVLRERVPALDVVLVEIDDDDYRQLFHETSPLEPQTLTDLIDAVARNQPKLIAVDIDTSAKVFTNVKLSQSWPPIVWARGAHQGTLESNQQDTNLRVRNNDALILERVLGRTDRQIDLSSGIALMPLDSDIRIRHFRREYLATNEEGSSNPGVRTDSFHWAIVKKYCDLAKVDERCKTLVPSQAVVDHDEDDLILNLAIEPSAFKAPITASRVLGEANTGNAAGSSPVFLSLKDKIVFLGGKYEASSDYHETPTGIKYGLDLTAIAVESELSGTGLRNATHLALVVLEILAGLALVVLNYFFPHGWKHLIALAAIPLVALFGSLIAFSSLALWANFIPTLLATQAHRLYDKLAEAKKLEGEVLDLRRRIKDYEHGIAEDHTNSLSEH